MHQAEGLRLQQDVREKELELELCYRRMEKGEPPNLTIEREWLCLVRDAEVKARDKDIAREVGVMRIEREGGGCDVVDGSTIRGADLYTHTTGCPSFHTFSYFFPHSNFSWFFLKCPSFWCFTLQIFPPTSKHCKYQDAANFAMNFQLLPQLFCTKLKR